MQAKQTWRQLLVQYGSDFLAWLDVSATRLGLITSLASHLESFLCSILDTPEACEQFWSVIADVRASCNDALTFEKPYAAAAYAYVHLLDRYWRTWDVLIELVSAAALPLGKEGVRMLDVGTGPGPTPYAMSDFYQLLQTFGKDKGIEAFASQEIHVAVVERSREMTRFLHNFSEITHRPGPFGADQDDFATIDPAADRTALREYLLRQEYYDPSGDEYYTEYSPDEANYIAQRHARYRLVMFSNFLTLGDTVHQFEASLRALFLDLRYGSVVIVLGARGTQYEAIYKELETLAQDCGLKHLADISQEMGSQSYSEAAPVIKRSQHNVFCHLERVAGVARILRHKSYPDYWNPLPSSKKRSKFGLRIFRKGGWPQSHPNRLPNRQPNPHM